MANRDDVQNVNVDADPDDGKPRQVRAQLSGGLYVYEVAKNGDARLETIQVAAGQGDVSEVSIGLMARGAAVAEEAVENIQGVNDVESFPETVESLSPSE